MHQTLIIGIGNAFRGDDGLGPYVAERFAGDFARFGAACACSSGEGFDLMEKWKPYARVVLVDAVAARGRPGEILRFDVRAQAFPKELFVYSTHALSVVQTLELARAMDELPAVCLFYGVVGETFAAGEGLSETVRQAVPELVRRIGEDLRAA